MEFNDTELTRLAADKVMGWHYWDCMLGDYEGPTPMFTHYGSPEAVYYGDQTDPIRSFNPLTDWRAAGEIVEKMRADQWYLQTDIGPTSPARATFHLGNAVHTARDTGGNMPRAITIAALLAVGAIKDSPEAEAKERA